MSQRKLTPTDIQFLQEAMNAGSKNGSIRLREGEYQYDLAKTIAYFQLGLYFPDVKDVIRKQYGEEKANDIQFVRKIQTILKKMEKSNVVRILPKKKPWELQRYMLSSFQFRDSDKNLVVLATDQEIKQARGLLNSIVNQRASISSLDNTKIKMHLLLLIIAASYATIVWNLMQPVVSSLIFIPAFLIAIACAIVLGKMLA